MLTIEGVEYLNDIKLNYVKKKQKKIKYYYLIHIEDTMII